MPRRRTHEEIFAELDEDFEEEEEEEVKVKCCKCGKEMNASDSFPEHTWEFCEQCYNGLSRNERLYNTICMDLLKTFGGKKGTYPSEQALPDCLKKARDAYAKEHGKEDLMELLEDAIKGRI